MSLAFHKTFPLDCESVAKILSVVANNPVATNTEISELTGLGIGKNKGDGKVRPIIAYAAFAGLTAEVSTSAVREMRLTEIGRLVLERDATVRKPVTHWVMHYHLSRASSEAEAWTYFVHEFLPLHASFDRTALEAGLQQKFGDRATVKSINPGVLLKSYLSSNALGRLRLIREASRNNYVRGQPDIPTPYIVAYILAEIWEAKHSTRIMAETSELDSPGHLATTVGLKEAELQEQLNRLTHLGVIGQMREAPPYQVVRQWEDKLSLLRAAYEDGD